MNLASRWRSRRSACYGPYQKRGLRFETLELRRLLAADINGTFYEDVDRNGIKSGPDNTLAGWTAFVDIDRNGVLNNLPGGASEPFAVSGSGGDYVINMNGQPTGVYRVSQILQADWTPISPVSRDVVFTAGQSTNKIDFFNFAGGTIEGIVWQDLNQDGIRDDTDPGLAGWTVFLDLPPVGGGSRNQMLDLGEPSTVTDSLGHYSFSDLPAGDYEVTEVQPAGWDVPKGYDIQQTATVVALKTTVADFANFSDLNGSIEGIIWNDINGDGDRAVDPVTGLPTEPGLEGWTVFVDANTNGSLDTTEQATTTDADGKYYFVSVLEGTYRIKEILPPNWSPAPGYAVEQTVSVLAGEKTQEVDFANFTVLNGAITGTVWNDVNRDGVRNTVFSGGFSDPGLDGWTVYLDMNRNGAFDTDEPTATTDIDGVYVFPDLQIGEYEVIEIVPSGWETAPGFGDNYTVRVYSGATSTAPDFANFNLSTLVPGSISGNVWDDVNGNGIRDTVPSAEPGSAGWTVFVDLNSNRLADATEPQAISVADGTYTINGVTPGTSTVVIQSRSGWHHTFPISGTRTLSLKNGENASGINFGEQQVRDKEFSGTVFVDSNHDGVRDAGEKGLSGIVVYLDLNNNSALDSGEPTATTSDDKFFTPAVDEAGTYSFTHLAANMYEVRQIVKDELSATPDAARMHTVDLVTNPVQAGVDFADVYRRNEIHGIKFDDLDGNGVRDTTEPAVAGTTVFIDSNRNGILDTGEPQSVTDKNGAYEFLDLSPGAYVVREIPDPGRYITSPNTVGGILWPGGVSNPAVGNVTPLSITKSLAVGEHFPQKVTITLPGSGGLTNLVDVFLLFDDTGSFTFNSPIVRNAFPTIMADLQASLPGVDLGFGVGRFEEYGNFGAEYSTGRPFILNQPIVAASTTGYQAAIQAALDRTAPGYGGDQPETDIEALYQLVTGLGFDGNNNGSVMDSGAAGLASTQLTPGNSGDVPSFASFTVDTASGALPSAGSIGGGGFRAGALPVILLATDTGFAYQPKGEATVTGIDGLSLPISALTQTSRPTTPFASGAGLQETITGLNALGALVIGLGTNTAASADPRLGLESIAKLTGATNQTSTTIANGTSDPISPGDPFYFQIASGFASSVSAGVTKAIQNAVTNVAVNITVQASDPRVHIINHSGTQMGVAAGQMAAFDIEFVGDGVPYRFDLQFVREGTNVVLGSIPVVLGTPIPGDGYHFDDLDDGEIELEDDFGDSLDSTLTPNVAPSFVAGSDQIVAEDAGLQTVAPWATNISPGPASEASQIVDFIVTNDNPSLFSLPPSISSDGTLRFTSAPDANGNATVTVVLHDNGGTANGGHDTSAPQTFLVTVTALNDAPTGGVFILGDATEDKVLTADASSVADADGLGIFSYLWSNGATTNTITLGDADVDKMITVTVSYTDGQGTAESLTSTPVGPVANVNDAPIGNVVITGTATEGQVLTADTSAIADADGLGVFSYLWSNGATTSAITLGDAEVGQTITVTVSYSDGHGTPESLSSAPVGPVANVNDTPTGVPIIAGTARAGQLLSAVTSSISDADGLGAFAYQWLRDSVAIAGATGIDYLLATIDVGSLITLQVSYVDGHGTTEGPLTSLPTSPVTDATPGGTKFFVVDQSKKRTFEYDAQGVALRNDSLNKEEHKPRGIAANPDGSTLWVVDAKGEVFIYANGNQLLGSWEIEGVDKPEGITVHGNDLWIVDRGEDRVYFFRDGAIRRSDKASPTSSFRLDRANTNPMDLVTDGIHIWVVNDARYVDNVFRYSIGGSLEGNWQIDEKNAKPTGITIDPNDVNHIWIVDAGTDSVYQYDAATIRIAGQQSANGAIFALAPANRNPQGIADPRPALSVAKKSIVQLPDAVRVVDNIAMRQFAFPSENSVNWPSRGQAPELHKELPKLDSLRSSSVKSLGRPEIQLAEDHQPLQYSQSATSTDRAISEFDFEEEILATLDFEFEIDVRHASRR